MHDQIEDRKQARMDARHIGSTAAEISVEREEELAPVKRRIGPGLFVAAVLVAIATGIWLLA